ncbi:hypothetical protein BLA29_002224, partial [Euroglyphus maynei]
FYGIYYPFNNGFSHLVRRYVIVFIWLFSLTISSPWLIFFDVHTIDNQVMCHEHWPEEWTSNFYFLFVNFGLQYLLPVLIIIFFYILLYVKISRRQLPLNIGNGGDCHEKNVQNNDSSIDKMNSRIVKKSRLKVLKMLITIVSVFVLSWLPLYVIFCFLKFSQIDENSFKGVVIIGLTPLAQWLGAANSCINPILYFFFNPKFRSYLQKSMTKNCSKQKYRNHRGLNYLYKNDTNYLMNRNRENLIIIAPTTPTSLELNNSSNKPQASPNIFNSSSSSSLSKINVKNNNDDQNRNTIIAYNENKSDHKHETLLLSQRSHTNYLDSPESNKMDEINAKIHPIIHLKCDVDSVPTPTKAAITILKLQQQMFEQIKAFIIRIMITGKDQQFDEINCDHYVNQPDNDSDYHDTIITLNNCYHHTDIGKQMTINNVDPILHYRYNQNNLKIISSNCFIKISTMNHETSV